MATKMPATRTHLRFSIALALAVCGACRDFPIDEEAPVAIAGGDQELAAGPVDVTLDGSDSEDVDGQIVTYEWFYTGDPRGDEGLGEDDAGLADVADLPVFARPLPDFCPPFEPTPESQAFVPQRWCPVGDEAEIELTLDDGVYRFTLYVTDDDGRVSADSVTVSVGQ